jgi:HEAT repeat protein
MRVEMAARLNNPQAIEQGVGDTSEEIRIAALQSLFEARPDRGIVLATDLLKNGSGASRLMRESAVTLLGDTESKEAIPILLEVARTDSDTRLRRRAIEALAEIEDDSVLEPLKQLALKSADVSVARAALEAMSERESTARPFFLEVARSATNTDLRLEAIEQLGELENDPAVVNDLVQLMASEKDVRIRRAIIEALGEREDNASAESLIRLYDAEKNESVREIIIEALGESEQKPALQKLTEIALRDPSLRLRKRALEHIGDSDDPDAYKFLEELLRKN